MTAGTQVVRALLTVAAAGLFAAPALADTPPYSFPVSLPGPATSPAVDPAAPYTPAVLSLISNVAEEQPVLVVPFIAVIRRILPAKLQQLRDQMPFSEPPIAWTSRTSTVRSSECGEPSVAAVTS